MFRHCFVTVGTTRFDALCSAILSEPVQLTLVQLGCRHVTLQVGHSDIQPGNFVKCNITFEVYRFKDSIEDDINNADFVISHAGAGSCLEVLEKNKPLLVVINEELMDNHQLELADQLQVLGHLNYCTCDTLEATLQEVDLERQVPFAKPDTSLFTKYLDTVLKVKQKLN